MKSVKIYSIHFDRPEFIQWQYDSFKTHLIDEFEYIVVNNAKDAPIRSKINDICSNINIKTIETESKSNLAGKHHVDSFNNIWKNYAVKNSGYSIMIDGDCFLIKRFSVNNFMKENVLAGPKQQRNYIYHYLTPTIIIADTINMPTPEIIDWEGIGANDTRLDTGGGLYLYYEKYKEVKGRTKELKSTWHIKKENKNRQCIPDELIDAYDDSYNIEFFGNEFLHYCRSSNWDNQTIEHHINKSSFVKDFLYKTINGNIIAKEHNFQIDNDIYFGWGKYE